MRSLASDSEINVTDKLTIEEVRAVRERLKIPDYLKEEE